MKKVGLAAFEHVTKAQDSYSQLSNDISDNQLHEFQVQLTQFRSALQHFAEKHRKTIASDPTFRAQFQQMCVNIGVDPLSGPRKSGWWAETLGFYNDWTFELGVQIVDICVSTRDVNGGVIEMNELIRLLRKLRGIEGENKIGVEDVMRSIDILGPLGAGYQVIDLGHNGAKAVRSVVKQLDQDQGNIIVLASENGGRITERSLMERFGWNVERARTALQNATTRDGICWVDIQTHGEPDYWVPGAMKWDEKPPGPVAS